MGQPYHARILHQLKNEMPATPNSELMMPNKIQEQLAKQKTQLQCQLGNPNRCQTWLEDLAEAQAQARGTTQKKQLKQRIHMEEQCNHPWQIK